jgi:hypothetical protein
MSSKPFSARSALDNDFNLTVVFVVPLVIWAVYVLSMLVGGGSKLILVVAILATLASPLVLVRRLRSLRAFLEQGEEVTGELVKVYFFQDRGRIDYVYTYAEKKYNGSLPIHKNVRTQSLSVGQGVKVIVDKKDPEHTLLLDLYT